ncbi:hypothetical protein [Cellulomonas sp. KH9]|nr:hypothetical protein [Cellulomonas sp. KH9]SFJ65194.1 hypothetical protein SAMN05216467_0349 [Cellulomonas sp. KH9]
MAAALQRVVSVVGAVTAGAALAVASQPALLTQIVAQLTDRLP